MSLRPCRRSLFLLLAASAPALFAQGEDALALALEEGDAPAAAASPAAPPVAPAAAAAGPKSAREDSAAAFADAFAGLLLSDLRGASWLVAAPGALADSVEARAAAAGVPLHVLRIDATGGEGPELTAAEAAALPPRVVAARDLGAAAFVLAWLGSDPSGACSNVVLTAFPTLPETAGFVTVPDGPLFRIAPPDSPESPIDAKALAARHAAWRDEAGELLARCPDDARATAAQRAYLSLLDNELGVLLATVGGRSSRDAALSAFRAANAALPEAVSPLLNLATLARDGLLAAGDSRPRLAAGLDAAVSGADPSRLWTLAVTDGRVLRPSDFLETGWTWALSGCRRDDTNSLVAAFARLPDAAARRALVSRLQPGIALRDGNSRVWYDFLVSPEMRDGWSAETAAKAARLLFDTGIRPRAMRLLERAAALPGADPAALAVARLELGSRSGDLAALPDARAAVAACADPAERLRRRLAVVAALIEAQAPFPELRDEAAAALREAGPDAPAWLGPVFRAAAAFAEGDPVRARVALEGVPADDPGAWPALRLLLLAELFTTGTENTHAEALLALRPRDHLAHYVLGNHANVVGHDPAAAISHLQASIAERPTWMALNDLASLLAAHGDPRLGERMARDAIRVTNGAMPALHDTLGETLMAQGNATGAADAFRAAIRGAAAAGAPTAVFHLHLAEAMLESGDAIGALDELSAVEARLEEFGDDPEPVLRLETLRRRAEEKMGE